MRAFACARQQRCALARSARGELRGAWVGLGTRLRLALVDPAQHHAPQQRAARAQALGGGGPGADGAAQEPLGVVA